MSVCLSGSNRPCCSGCILTAAGKAFASVDLCQLGSHLLGSVCEYVALECRTSDALHEVFPSRSACRSANVCIHTVSSASLGLCCDRLD
jgi:hypothetical protein